jgi:trans-aconitate methyltransferase
MTEPFANMTAVEAERFMKGNTHPMREAAARMVGERYVIDLGCGKGIGVSELYTSDQYFGIDCSHELVNIARRKNVGYIFRVSDILSYFKDMRTNSIQVGIMISVLEHVSSLETARSIYNEAERVCEELLVGWHHPPHYSETKILQVQAELDNPIYQNHYAEGTFDGAVEVIPVRAGELWVVHR